MEERPFKAALDASEMRALLGWWSPFNRGETAPGLKPNQIPTERGAKAPLFHPHRRP
ncbi:hypothetical protein SBA1_880034 [Candidatus Sulfotelmatobacter kueseliae]|uniref:Uncharacterized protein n=1 Tax=Candidatus Sulfotelmatobacter kueseliae TaxID=2042962 RepID=A0A2U3L9Z0_9BACT|nr:hypothetical protein SBA1_880034 [Candidatus Sulfotelmatobacter kueseliae]